MSSLSFCVHKCICIYVGDDVTHVTWKSLSDLRVNRTWHGASRWRPLWNNMKLLSDAPMYIQEKLELLISREGRYRQERLVYPEEKAYCDVKLSTYESKPLEIVICPGDDYIGYLCNLYTNCIYFTKLWFVWIQRN